MPTTTSAEELTRQAHFVFIGLVAQLRAATMSQVPVTDRTAIIKVVKVLQVPASFGDWTNQQITVQLSDGAHVQQGQQYVFYTNGWLFGESIAVHALAQHPATPEVLQRQVSDPVQALADRDLQARVARADLIVAGKVTTTRLPATPATDRPGPPVPVTRKHPRQHEAVIEIESVEKGNYSEKQVVAFFHTSTDVAWHKSPKFKPGDEGIFLLHKVETPETEVLYSCSHELDFQPWSKLDQIRSYIKFSANP